MANKMSNRHSCQANRPYIRSLRFRLPKKSILSSTVSFVNQKNFARVTYRTKVTHELQLSSRQQPRSLQNSLSLRTARPVGRGKFNSWSVGLEAINKRMAVIASCRRCRSGGRQGIRDREYSERPVENHS